MCPSFGRWLPVESLAPCGPCPLRAAGAGALHCFRGGSCIAALASHQVSPAASNGQLIQFAAACRLRPASADRATHCPHVTSLKQHNTHTNIPYHIHTIYTHTTLKQNKTKMSTLTDLTTPIRTSTHTFNTHFQPWSHRQATELQRVHEGFVEEITEGRGNTNRRQYKEKEHT